MTSRDPAIELVGLHKAFDGHVAVEEVSLAVATGSIFGLLGPNGAGKTTTLRMLLDIFAPDRGEVRLFGRPRRPGDNERLGYLPEERGLYRKMTVEDHLRFLAELHGVARGEAKQRAAHWLDRVGLAEWSARKVETLSKGMQQKVQLAGTVIHEPELLVLDEPFSGLDPINQGLFKEILSEHRTAGRTVVLSTHVLEQAEKLCDSIALVARGRVVLSGELAALQREHAGRRVLVELEDAGTAFEAFPGVEGVEREGAAARLDLAGDTRPADLLAALVREGVAVRGFRVVEPDLETLFVEAVRDAG